MIGAWESRSQETLGEIPLNSSLYRRVSGCNRIRAIDREFAFESVLLKKAAALRYERTTTDSRWAMQRTSFPLHAESGRHGVLCTRFKQNRRSQNIAGLDANHLPPLVVAKIGKRSSTALPRIPDNRRG